MSNEHARYSRDAVFELGCTITEWDDAYYHPLALPLYDRLVGRMLELMDVPPGGTVLDAGCGPGVHAIRVARLGRRVKAIDISNAMLQEARRRAAAAGVLPRIDFAREDLTALSLPSESFEHVFSWGVVIHIRDIGRALDELARIVRRGGTLALHVTNAAALDHRVESLGRRLLRRPFHGLERHEPGVGAGYLFHGRTLWVWRVDSRWLIRTMASRGLRLRRRLMGTATELHTRLPALKRPLHRLNDFFERLGCPRSLAATTLFVFEKVDSPRR